MGTVGEMYRNNHGALGTASSIIKWGLEIAERVMKIRAEVERVRSFRIQNDAAERALEVAAEQARNEGTKEIVGKVAKDLGLKKGTDAEKIGALTHAVEKLTDFIEKGGQVEFVLRKDVAEDDAHEGDADPERAERIQLWKRFEEIRKLEQRIKQIEHHHEPEPKQR